jgi:hypothetical protein
MTTTPDLPDRTAEIYDDNGTPTVGRVYRDGAAITMSVDKEGNVRPQLRKLRTWFVGKDGLTSVERERDRLVLDLAYARRLIWRGWYEMNAIRARQGAPDGITHEAWDLWVEDMKGFLGDDALPWPPGNLPN